MIRIDSAEVSEASASESVSTESAAIESVSQQNLGHPGEILARTDAFEVVPRTHYIPETYEPNYSYPLLVWLTYPGQNFDLSARMDAVSDRNYLGLQIDLSRFLDPVQDPEAFVQQLQVHELTLHKLLRGTISKFRRDYKVHSERIYLAGMGQAAVAALHLGFTRPEWFGGVISIDAGTDQIPHLLRRYRHLHGERVLLAHSRGADESSRTAEQRLSRMLFTAGLKVCRRAYATIDVRTRRGRAPDLYRDIDRWVMQDIAQAQLA